MKEAARLNRKPRRRVPRGPLATWTLWILLALIVLPACSRKDSSGPAAKPGMREAVPVTVGTVIQKTIPVQVRAIGNVQAYSTIAVKSQVAGELMRVHFKEGQDVKKGDLLFTIDPRPFQAQLQQTEANLAKDMAQAKQAEANLARDLAQAKNAEVEARRYAHLVEEGIVSKEQYDQMRTNWEAQDAVVRADRAAVENAQAAIRANQAAIVNVKLQLEYCYIRSQVDGRTGNLIVHPGNIIKMNDTTPLVTINQIKPIYVSFAVPEQILPDIKKYMASGTLAVDTLLSKDEKQRARGELTFVNNAVDPATGTITLKATFPNPDKTLWPGQFVNVVLMLTTQPNALVVPSQAVQTGQNGQYVFVVKPDLTVESRPVVSTRTVGAEAVVEKGLAVGERVVTDGQLRLAPGTKVEIKKSPSTANAEENWP